MQKNIEERVLSAAQYIADTGATVRDTAKCFGISKSTVHKDMTQRLQLYDISLFRAVREKLQINKEERHIRGGIATHNKYKGAKK
ncbi:MAG: sporulation transcriptional regulator SpoIIID [Clostridia bacterium]|nr:sporulation transcriptional regulator SpoIIID [Clostridia bacterium]